MIARLIAVVCLAWILWKERCDYKYSKATSPQNGAKRSKQNAPALTFDCKPMQPQSAEDAYRAEILRQTTRQADWTRNAVIVAGIAFSLSCIGVYFVRGTLIANEESAVAAHDQIREMRAEQRPWVSVSIDELPVVTIAPKKGAIAIAFVLKNVGHSVALGAIGSYSAYGEYNSDRLPVENPCTRRIVPFEVQDARTLFPGEAYITKRHQLLFGGWDIERSVAPQGTVVPRLIVDVLGCVTYTYEGSATSHHTPFAFRIYGSEYAPGIPVGFPIEKYGEVTPGTSPVDIYIRGANPD